MQTTDLKNALQHSDNWLQSEIEAWLTPLMSEPSSIMFRKLKAICEIGYLEYFVNPSPNLKIENQICIIVRYLIKDPTFKSMVRHNIEHANLFVPLLAIYLSHPTNDENEAIDVINLIKYNLLSCKERLPFREIDLLHISYKITQDASFMKEASIIAKFGCVGRFKNTSSFSASDEYALTHTVFYMTDFGRMEWNETILPQKKLCTLINTLCDQAKNKNDIDIFGEYVLCKQYLHFPIAEIETDLHELLDIQNKDAGYWQGPTELEKILLKEGFESKSVCFFENYHTSIIVRLLLYNHQLGSKCHDKGGAPLLDIKALDFKPIYYLSEEHINSRLGSDCKELFEILRQYHSLGKMEIAEHLYGDPILILLGIDVMYLFYNDKDHTSVDYSTLFQELMNTDILSQNFESRFVRIWCQINLIFNRMTSINADKIFYTYHLLATPNEDNIILLLLLFKSFSEKIRSEAQACINKFCMKSIFEKDIRAINYLLFYAKDENVKDYYDELLALFLSLNSVTSSYGWLESSNPDIANFYDILSYITAIKLEKENRIEIKILR